MMVRYKLHWLGGRVLAALKKRYINSHLSEYIAGNGI